MLVYRAHSRAEPEVAWKLVAQPSRWHEWAPHLRGAWGLGEPEVRAGARGAARLLGLVPIPAVVTEKGVRCWRWRVGPVELEHRVETRDPGCDVVVTLEAPGALERVLSVTYGPVVALLVRNLARVAAQTYL